MATRKPKGDPDAKPVEGKTASNENTAPPEAKKERPRSPINGQPLPIGKAFKTREEASEAGKKGGKRSGEVRRERKTLRQELLDLLSVAVKDSNGVEHTRNESISVALIAQALKGNVRAYETIRDTIGEKQQEKVDVSMSLPQFDALDAAFEKMGDDGP